MMKEMAQLAAEVHSSVVSQGLSFKSVSIAAVMDDLTVHNRSKTFESPTKSFEMVEKTVKELLEQLLKDEKKHLVRRVGVKIFNFVEEKGQKRLTDF